MVAGPGTGGEFPYIARHVVQAPAVGAQLAGLHRAATDTAARQLARPRGACGIITLARVIERICWRDTVALRIGARRAGTIGVLPFLFGRQTVALAGLPAQPGAVIACLGLPHVDDRLAAGQPDQLRSPPPAGGAAVGLELLRRDGQHADGEAVLDQGGTARAILRWCRFL